MCVCMYVCCVIRGPDIPEKNRIEIPENYLTPCYGHPGAKGSFLAHCGFQVLGCEQCPPGVLPFIPTFLSGYEGDGCFP